MRSRPERLPAPPSREEDLARIEGELRRGLREIRYGSIEIVIHDSRVVQIERREKVRFDRQDSYRADADRSTGGPARSHPLRERQPTGPPEERTHGDSLK